MATAKGICKNCGSLIVFNDQDSKCECLFCNCVFPSEEAIELMKNPSDHEFPNEKYEKTQEASHYYATTSLDKVAPIWDREKTTKNAYVEDSSRNEFELSPNDVKAPKKVVMTITLSAVAFVAIVAAISIPLWFTRTNLLKAVEDRIPDVVANQIEVNTSINPDTDRAEGYFISGVNCQKVKLVTADSVTEDVAVNIFENYAQVRAEAGNGKVNKNDLVVEIYCEGGIYRVTSAKDQITAVYTANEVPEVTEAAE